MNMTITPLRRLGATLAIAGFAALGSVAVAPAASADQDEDDVVSSYQIEDGDDSDGKIKIDDKVDDGPMSVVKKNNGPDAFIILEHGKKPVFFCEPAKPNKQKNKCESVVVGGNRF